MKTVKHNIGAIVKLPVQQEVTVKGKRFYIVRYEDRLCRVPVSESQNGKKLPSFLQCRLKSINDFGFPEFVQANVEDEEQLGVKKENTITSFFKRFSRKKEEEVTANNIVTAPVHNDNDIVNDAVHNPKNTTTSTETRLKSNTYSIDYEDKLLYDFFGESSMIISTNGLLPVVVCAVV